MSIRPALLAALAVACSACQSDLIRLGWPDPDRYAAGVIAFEEGSDAAKVIAFDPRGTTPVEWRSSSSSAKLSLFLYERRLDVLGFPAGVLAAVENGRPLEVGDVRLEGEVDGHRFSGWRPPAAQTVLDRMLIAPLHRCPTFTTPTSFPVTSTHSSSFLIPFDDSRALFGQIDGALTMVSETRAVPFNGPAGPAIRAATRGADGRVWVARLDGSVGLLHADGTLTSTEVFAPTGVPIIQLARSPELALDDFLAVRELREGLRFERLRHGRTYNLQSVGAGSGPGRVMWLEPGVGLFTDTSSVVWRVGPGPEELAPIPPGGASLTVGAMVVVGGRAIAIANDQDTATVRMFVLDAPLSSWRELGLGPVTGKVTGAVAIGSGFVYANNKGIGAFVSLDPDLGPCPMPISLAGTGREYLVTVGSTAIVGSGGLRGNVPGIEVQWLEMVP